MKYTEVDIKLEKIIPFSEILIAKLNEIGYDSYKKINWESRHISKQKFLMKKYLRYVRTYHCKLTFHIHFQF